MNRSHRIADQVRTVIGWLGKVPSESQFASKGVLTPLEFLEAGDQLVYQFPTWKWQSCPNRRYHVFWLPPDKQFLLTRNIPCRHRVADWDDRLRGETVADGWLLPSQNTNPRRKKRDDKPSRKCSRCSKIMVATTPKSRDEMNGVPIRRRGRSLPANSNRTLVNPVVSAAVSHQAQETLTPQPLPSMAKRGRRLMSTPIIDSPQSEFRLCKETALLAEASSNGPQEPTIDQSDSEDTSFSEPSDITSSSDDNDGFVDVACEVNDLSRMTERHQLLRSGGQDTSIETEFTVITSTTGDETLLIEPATTGVTLSEKDEIEGQNPRSDTCTCASKEAQQLRKRRRVVQRRTTGANYAKSAVVPTRTYDLSITYDKYYQTPRLWLFGYDENGIPLTSEAIFEDILPDYLAKTVTVDPHPCTGVPTVSIHPCNHSSVMKNVVQSWIQSGLPPRHDLSLFVLLKMVSSALPTVNYDFTIDIEMPFLSSIPAAVGIDDKNMQQRISDRD